MMERISLLAIDVGFDLRKTKHPVLLPPDRMIEVEYEAKLGGRGKVRGRYPNVARVLQGNGYRVEPKPPESIKKDAFGNPMDGPSEFGKLQK